MPATQTLAPTPVQLAALAQSLASEKRVSTVLDNAAANLCADVRNGPWHALYSALGYNSLRGAELVDCVVRWRAHLTRAGYTLV